LLSEKLTGSARSPARSATAFRPAADRNVQKTGECSQFLGKSLKDIGIIWIVCRAAGPLLPANFIEVVKVTPGQRVSAISNDAGTFSLSITELTD
jgi:hypothetical protein